MTTFVTNVLAGMRSDAAHSLKGSWNPMHVHKDRQVEYILHSQAFVSLLHKYQFRTMY